MKVMYPEHWPQFYTATVYKWQHLPADDKHKDIIIESLCPSGVFASILLLM